MGHDEPADPHDEHRHHREGDYRIARIATALTLTIVLAALLLIDALSAEYEVNPVTEAILVGAVVTLLGLEAASIWRGTSR